MPHKGNDYRPHLIRWQGLSLVLVAVLLMQMFYSFATTGSLSILGSVSDISITELLDETNEERDKAGLEPLALNKQLTQAAELKAEDMIENDYWAHVSPDGITPWKWYKDAGYEYSIAGENLAKNYPSASATVAAWMASEAHRENVLRGEFDDVGFAVVQGMLEGEDTVLVVAEYGAEIAVTPEVPATYAATVDENSIPVLTHIGLYVQSLDPVTIGSLVILLIVVVISLITHHYRNKLPRSWQKSWRMHHGAYKAVGVVILMALLLIATGGGQI